MRILGFILALLTLNIDSLATEISCIEKTDVAKVWAGHPVDFDLATTERFQYVAYYDTTRTMIIARRETGSSNWQYHSFATKTGWDSHNYIDMALDDSGYIHISGNMHNVNLIYFRSTKPYEIDNFVSPGMTGNLENSVTYPVFIKGVDGRLFFQYRDGGSGNGTTLWNGYDLKTKKWTRITTAGLFDGQGEVNAYQTVPVMGPDGFFHVIWMWRNTPVANTNHHLSHMKSRDLVNWQSMSGSSLKIPVTQSTDGVVADPVQSGNGLINMDFGIGWDSKDQAILTYHKYNSSNISQIFNTRWENGSWKIYQTSKWTGFKWDLDRTGSLTHDIAAQPVQVENGQLVQNYIYRDNIARRWILDEATLSPKEDDVYQIPDAMKEMYTLQSTFPEMQVNVKKEGNYYIKWETLPINQDQPRTSYPSSSMLRIYQYSSSTKIISKKAYDHIGSIVKQSAGRLDISLFDNNRGNTNRSVSVYNILGIRVYSISDISSSEFSIPINAWAKGMYIAEINDGIKNISVKFNIN